MDYSYIYLLPYQISMKPLLNELSFQVTEVII